MSLSTPVSKEQENEAMWAITRTGWLRSGKIKRDLRNPGLWCDILVTGSGCGLHGHGALYFFCLNEYTQQDKMSFHMHTSLQDCFRNMTVTSVFLPQLVHSSYLNQTEHLWDDVEFVDSRMNASLRSQQGPTLPEERLQHLVESMLPWNGKRSSHSTSLNTYGCIV